MLWLTGNPATINAKPTHTETNVSRQQQIFVGLEFASRALPQVILVAAKCDLRNGIQ